MTHSIDTSYPRARLEQPPAIISLGVIALATDRVGVADFESFVEGAPGVQVFSTRVPMGDEVTPESLRSMRQHLRGAASNLVPGSAMDVVGFSCTSGTVAIGTDSVRAEIISGRPGVHVTTPIEAGVLGLKLLGITEIALLMPYRRATSQIVADFFAEHGLRVGHCSTFDLAGDSEMNRVSTQEIVDAGAKCLAQAPQAQALFISCTGLRTRDAIELLEHATHRKVVTSNQALAWHALLLAGFALPLEDRGELFRMLGSKPSFV